MTSAAAETTAPVHVTTEGTTVVLTVVGRLDAGAGDALVDAATAAVRSGAERVDLDLRALATFDDDGAAALVRCRDVASALPQGLHYRTGRGPGRAALLSAYRAGHA